MDSDAIKRFLLLAGVGTPALHVECADRDYALPAADWVIGEFARAWMYEAGRLGLAYDSEVEDCDDFARYASAFAALLHARTPDRPPGTALAFGECWYTTDAGDYHAINCFLTTAPGADLQPHARLCFFEPQTGEPLALTVNEQRSIEFLRL